jgi:signal peptidase I
MSSKNSSRLRHLRYFLYFVPILAIVGGYGLLTIVTQESYPFTIVTGTSMQPTILPGSVALISKVSFDQLQKGDVIVFAPELSRMFPCDSTPTSSLTGETSVPCFVIHRIVNIQMADNGSRIMTTKGDANSGSIPLIDTNISESAYIGKVVVQFPLAGYVTETPYNEYIAIVIFGALIGELFFERRGSSKSKNQSQTQQLSETPGPEANAGVSEPKFSPSPEDLSTEP